MFTTLMIVSLDQGKLHPAPRSIGQFDAHLLRDIGYDENAEAAGVRNSRSGLKALLQRGFALTWFPSLPQRSGCIEPDCAAV